MSAPTPQHTRRRSSRLQVKIPVLLTSVDPGVQYSEVCEAQVVNAHGCGIRAPRPLDTGVAVHLRIKGGGQTSARIVGTQFTASDRGAWTLGVSLDRPGNFWGVTPCPQDWLRPSTVASHDTAKLLQPLAAPVPGERPLRKRLPTSIPPPVPENPGTILRAENQGNSSGQPTSLSAHGAASVAVDVGLQPPPSDEIAEGVSQPRGRVSALLTEIVQPLQTELQKLLHQFEDAEQKRHALGLAVAQIPSEIEGRLWIRLRQRLDAEIARSTGALQTQVSELRTRLETILPEQNLTSSLRHLSAKIDAIDVDLHATIRDETTTARRLVGEAAEKIKAIEQLAGAVAERVAGVPDLVTSQIAQQQDSLLAVTRDYVHDIESLQQFRSDTESKLQVLEVQGGLKGLCEQVAQMKEEHLSALNRIDGQIRQQSEQTLSAAKTLIDEQRTELRENARLASGILQKIESAAESLKERFQKTVAEAQQQTLAVFENHINDIHENVRKKTADELQALHTQAKALSEDISGRLRYELTESLNRDREDIRAWLGHESEDFQKRIEAAVLQADAEIRARNYISMETAKNSGDDLLREIRGQLQERAHRASAEFEEQVNGRLSDFQTSLALSIGQLFEAARVQAAEHLKSFEIELNLLSQDSISDCRSALAQKLKLIANTIDVENGAKTLSG